MRFNVWHFKRNEHEKNTHTSHTNDAKLLRWCVINRGKKYSPAVCRSQLQEPIISSWYIINMLYWHGIIKLRTHLHAWMLHLTNTSAYVRMKKKNASIFINFICRVLFNNWMIKSLNAHLIIINRIVRVIEQQPLWILIFIYRTLAAADVDVVVQVTDFTYMECELFLLLPFLLNRTYLIMTERNVQSVNEMKII